MKLYGYFRSSSAFRVRIALNLKKIKHETDFIKLPAGVQFADEYCAVNPQARVPRNNFLSGLKVRDEGARTC